MGGNEQTSDNPKKREKIRKLRRGGSQRQRKDLMIKMLVVKRIGLKYPDTVADNQCAINISQHRQWRFQSNGVVFQTRVRS